MNPSDLGPKAEFGYGAGITGVSLFMHYLNDYVTPIATGVGAVAGAIVGCHALYRLVKPKKRLNRRATDRS